MSSSEYPARRRPQTISQLSERALDNLYDETKSLKHSVKAAEKYRKDARDYISKGDLENAFIKFARAVTLVLDKVPAHRDYYTLLTTTQRSNLNLNGSDILEELGNLKRKLTKRYEDWVRDNPEGEQLGPPATHSATDRHQEVDLSLPRTRSNGKERERDRHDNHRRISEDYALWRQDEDLVDDIEDITDRERRRHVYQGGIRDRRVDEDSDFLTADEDGDVLTKYKDGNALTEEDGTVLMKHEDVDVLTKHEDNNVLAQRDLLSDPSLFKTYLCRVFCIQFSDVIDLTGHIKRRRFIAAGGSGEVWEASWIALDTNPVISTPNALPIVAIKLIRLPPLRDEARKDKRFKMMKRELLVWSKLEHPHILPLIGIACIESDANLPAFISPWMENGNVMEFIKQNPAFPASRFLKGIIKGLHYLHTQIPVIVHGDIKGANVLINHREEACLSDFGLSRLIIDNTLWRTTATHARGTLRWMAPELIQGDMATPTIATDIYAFGMTCYEILSRGSPFAAVHDLAVMKKVTDGQRPAKIESFHSDETWSIITRCWAHEPTDRPSTEETLELVLRQGPGGDGGVAHGDANSGNGSSLSVQRRDHHPGNGQQPVHGGSTVVVARKRMIEEERRQTPPLGGPKSGVNVVEVTEDDEEEDVPMLDNTSNKRGLGSNVPPTTLSEYHPLSSPSLSSCLDIPETGDDTFSFSTLDLSERDNTTVGGVPTHSRQRSQTHGQRESTEYPRFEMARFTSPAESVVSRSPSPVTIVDGGPTLLPLEPARFEGDSTDSESIHERHGSQSIGYAESRKTRSTSPVTTTSPPLQERQTMEQIMSQHQRSQGYSPSINSMFSSGGFPVGYLPGSAPLYSSANEVLHSHRPPRSASPGSDQYQSAQRPSPLYGSASQRAPSPHLRSNYLELPQEGMTPAPVLTPPVIQAPPRSQPHNHHAPYPKGLKTVTVPKDCLQKFLGIGSANTAVNKETCGLLLGKDKGNKYIVTTLLIPRQHSTSDTCTMDGEELVLQFTEERSLITLGWIHTHPSQSCFMSSVDLHNHSGFQRMLPESFAIVCAPKSKPNFGIFRLTDPPGLTTILDCKATDAFHSHPDSPIYTDADKGHVQMKEGPLEIVDLR